MAYVNEKADGREFMVPVFGKKRPRKWTRDSEKEAILFSYYEDRECIGRTYFFFQYRGYGIKVILNGTEFVDPDTIKWKLVNIDIPKGVSKKEVLEELRQAIGVYGCNGSCSPGLPTGKAVTDF